MQFVLRLSPEIHRRLATVPDDGLVRSADPETIRALSVHLHETAHWWQHIGSTTGLMLSLSHPGQAHVNYSHLKSLLSTIGPQKSIVRWLEAEEGRGGPDTPAGHANIVVNNYYDIDFFRRLVVLPRSAQDFVNSNLFESAGHSFSIAYGNICSLLAATLGESQDVLPDGKRWEAELSRLRRAKADGFVRGAGLRLSPLGAREIFEGQARFMQLQFLQFASQQEWSWEHARTHGLLSGVYVEAFQTFLRLTGFDWPPAIDHQTTGLFLLVCDLAMNPGAAFPLELRFPKTFLVDVDPGMRFLFLCRALARISRGSSQMVKHYSKEEYSAVSDSLADLLLIDSPTTIFEAVASWPLRSSAVRALMAGHESFTYERANLAVRLLLAHFVAFAQDKMARPELFCWPGAWMAGDRVSADVAAVVERHAAPFVDKADADGIYPRLRRGRDEAIAHEAFSAFYAMNVVYDLTRQWITVPGPFRYEYHWLAEAPAHDMKVFGDRHFEMVFGVHPDRFHLL